MFIFINKTSIRIRVLLIKIFGCLAQPGVSVDVLLPVSDSNRQAIHTKTKNKQKTPKNKISKQIS